MVPAYLSSPGHAAGSSSEAVCLCPHWAIKNGTLHFLCTRPASASKGRRHDYCSVVEPANSTEIRCSNARAVTAADVWAHAPWGPRVSGNNCTNCTCGTAPDPCPATPAVIAAPCLNIFHFQKRGFTRAMQGWVNYLGGPCASGLPSCTCCPRGAPRIAPSTCAWPHTCGGG